MKGIVANLAYELAIRFAYEQLQNLVAGGYRLGYQQARRDSLRGFFPRASDDALDAALDKERRN